MSNYALAIFFFSLFKGDTESGATESISLQEQFRVSQQKKVSWIPSQIERALLTMQCLVTDNTSQTSPFRFNCSVASTSKTILDAHSLHITYITLFYIKGSSL